MLDVIGLGEPDGPLRAHAVPHVAGLVICRALVASGFDALLFDCSAVEAGESPLAADEAASEGERLYPWWPDIDYDVLLSNYTVWQLPSVMRALADDGDFRDMWSDATGHPPEWLNGTDGVAALAASIRSSVTPEAIGEAMPS